MHKNRTSPLPFYMREVAILGLFTLLTLVMLYPLSVNLTTMVPEPSDPLLNVWRMHWNVHAWLSGPSNLVNVFNTNIFYPFPLTLAYSEHFLLLSALALPFLLIPDSHLVGMNLSVLLTFVLSGYAMYLLVTAWTHHRWAGLVAGILFAFSPHRFGQLNHLELLVTQWMPLTLLALHWTLTRPGWRYPLLFGLFFNLQALSGFHFSLNLTIACALLALVYALSGRIYWRRGLGIAAALSILATLLINWPIWQAYLRFSDIMGAVRTPGEVRIYSAAFTDYLTAIPYNLLYGWTFGRWQSAGHQFQPLMPFGLAGLFLALFGLALNLIRHSTMTKHRKIASPPSSIFHPPPSTLHPPQPIIAFLLLLTLLAFLLSFGLNEDALGPSLAPLLQFSPYVWLYDHVTIFQGIRVPGRFGILVVIGLVGLAGWGVSTLLRTTHYALRRVQPATTTVLISLILLESWSVPLVGPEIPAGSQIAPVYRWLQTDTPPDAVVLELPFDGPSEFLYEYNSSYHWRRLANGGTGFTPPIYREMRQWFKTFPDARSVDVIQHLGLDLVILHSTAFEPGEWQRLLADLPLYLPAFSQINQIGEALVLHVNRPDCPAQPDQVRSMLTSTTGQDGLPNAVQVNYYNEGTAAFVADVKQASRLTFSGGADKNFTEPLVTPAGEAQAVLVPLPNERQADSITGAWLATLNKTVSVSGSASPTSESTANVSETQSAGWQPLGLKFADGPELVAYSLTPETPTACSRLELTLKWAGGHPDDTTTVQLLDPFGRVVLEQTAQPWANANLEVVDIRKLSLVGTLPAGRYGLRVFVKSPEGQARLAVTEAGVTIPPDRLPPLPLVIHPARVSLSTGVEPAGQSVLGDRIRFLGGQMGQDGTIKAGEWLRFTLFWQAEQPVETDLTVFTQLIGPDGQVWGQWDNQPKGGWYSTSLWPPNQPVADDYAFQLDPAAPAGEYQLIGGMYDSASGERVVVTAGPGQGNNFVEVAKISVANP